MKRIALTFVLLLTVSISATLYGQTTQDTAKASKYVYCELVGIQKFLSNKITLSVDFGEEKGLFQDPRLRDQQTGEIQCFNSMVDALNYMGNDGWEFVQAYLATVGDQQVTHWLLKKKK